MNNAHFYFGQGRSLAFCFGGNLLVKSVSNKTDATSTRREKLESKERIIVDVAYEMFGTKGFAKSTMSEIAKTAGVAEGTLYLYFNNKESLAGAVIASFYERITESAQIGVDELETTAEKLKFLATHHLTSILAEKRILQLLSILDRLTQTAAGDEIYRMNKRYVAVFDGVVRDGIWRGDIASGFTAWILRDIFYGALEYAMRTMEITDRHGEVERFSNELVAMVTNEQMLTGKRRKPVSAAELTKIARRFEGALDRIEAIAKDDEDDIS